MCVPFIFKAALYIRHAFCFDLLGTVFDSYKIQAVLNMHIAEIRIRKPSELVRDRVLAGLSVFK